MASATGTIPTTVAFGNVRLNAQRTLAVANTLRTTGAADYQDDLAVTATSGSAKVTAVAPANILADASGNVTLTAVTAGLLDNTLALAFTSTGKVAGTAITGLSSAALAGGTVTVTGAAYDLANASYASTLALGNRRVGYAVDVAIANAVRANGSAAYQDSLDLTVTKDNANLTLAGATANIAAAGSANVGVTASAAGSLAATLSLALVSNANNVADLANVTQEGGAIEVTGAAYDYAQATFGGATVAFGNVRTGATSSVALTNTTYTNAAYQDSLDAVASTAVGTLSLANPANILAGKSAAVTVTAAKAGSLAGDVTFALTSNANGVTGLAATTALAGQTVAVTGAAYDLANPTYASTLALGNLRRGVTTNLAVTNTTVTDAAYQDKLAVAATAGNGNLSFVNPADIAATASGNVGVTVAKAGSLAATATLGSALAPLRSTTTVFRVAMPHVRSRPSRFGNASPLSIGSSSTRSLPARSRYRPMAATSSGNRSVVGPAMMSTVASSGTSFCCASTSFCTV